MSESKDHLRDVFRAAGLRLTHQRSLILDVLDESDEHLDAEAVYERARLHDPEISLATVYRALAVLKDMGLVEEHRLGEEHSHYERVRDKPHYHFICLGCGKVIEFGTPLVAQINQKLSRQRGVRVVSTHLYSTGYCAQCQAKRSGQYKAGGQSVNGRSVENSPVPATAHA
jgi:Fur family ferric uptake transcriptional regulator